MDAALSNEYGSWEKKGGDHKSLPTLGHESVIHPGAWQLPSLECESQVSDIHRQPWSSLGPQTRLSAARFRHSGRGHLFVTITDGRLAVAFWGEFDPSLVITLGYTPERYWGMLLSVARLLEVSTGFLENFMEENGIADPGPERPETC
jgi:hypothetical protein